MSDATLLPPRSSAAPGIFDGKTSNSSGNDAEIDFDASLLEVSSQDATEEKSSDSGGKVPGKQKRKRTSPKDQAILEAEYKQNPKPNKAARAVIMEKVELNEKELQIWFQNRRQINRRKSRPLLPHELAAFGLGDMTTLTSSPSSAIDFNNNGPLREGVVQSEDNVTSRKEDISTGSYAQEDMPRIQSIRESVDTTRQGATDRPETCDSALPPSSSMLRTQSPPESLRTNTSSISLSDSVIKSFSSTPGYLANRWNPPNNSSTPNSTQIIPQVTPPIASNLTLPSSCPERVSLSDDIAPSTKVRLSMSLDGKAELVAADLSPSRERSERPSSSGSALPQHRMQGLQRSRSCLTFSPLLRLSSVNSPLIPRLPRGRSRDSRNWEFFCDSEARDELTTQAEHESNGSAVAAISLLRSASNSALKSSGNKRNAPSSRQDLSSHDKRRKFGRAMSSLARLQGSGIPSLSVSQSNKSKSGLVGSPSGDSDKENWIPAGGGNVRRRPLPSSRPNKPSQAQVLGNNSNIPTQAVNFGGLKNGRRKAAEVEPHIFEDQENDETNQEVEKFMRGEVSPSKKGDLDCIQGLLSLSQGNWR